MALDMNNPKYLLKCLLFTTLITQVVIDIGGITGVFFSLYPIDTYRVSGFYSFLNYKYQMSVYVVWLCTHYCSIIAMMIRSKNAFGFVSFGLTLSFLCSFTMGVNVATPVDLVLGWVAFNTYLISVCICVFSQQVREEFSDNRKTAKYEE